MYASSKVSTTPLYEIGVVRWGGWALSHQAKNIQNVIIMQTGFPILLPSDELFGLNT
jgi:hypothetical protein